MNVLIVGFDNSISPLKSSQLETVLKSQNSWARLNSNAFIVTSQLTASQLRDKIIAAAGSGDKLFVYNVTNRYWATSGMPADVSNWLQNNWSQS